VSSLRRCCAEVALIHANPETLDVVNPELTSRLRAAKIDAGFLGNRPSDLPSGADEEIT